MTNVLQSLHRRLCIVLPLLMLGSCFVGGCARKEEPEPTQTKEERRLQEKEMMHREMQNK